MEDRRDPDPGIDSLFELEDESTTGKAKGKRALLVDDAAPERLKFGAILRQLGCQVAEAADGRQALAVAKQTEPDLIVLDVMMPNRDGLETLKLLRQHQRFRTTPIVMLTARADAGTVREALTNQANDYILKASPPEEVKQRLLKYL